jgi:hypothetical protein
MADDYQPDGDFEAQEQPFGYVNAEDAPFDPSLLAVATEAEESDTADAGAEDQAEPDYKTLLAEREARIAELENETAAERKARQEREAQQAEYERQQYAAQMQAWEQQREQAIQHARTLRSDEALNYLAQFFGQREQAVFQWGQQHFTEKELIKLEKQAVKVASEYGLPEEEVEALVRAAASTGRADAMQSEAKRLKARTSKTQEELQSLREELNRIKAEGTRQKLSRSTRVGQGNRAVPPKVKPGTDDHLRSLLGPAWLK